MSRSFLNNNELEIEKLFNQLLENDINLISETKEIQNKIFRITLKIMKTLDIPYENFSFGIYNASTNDLTKHYNLLNLILNNLEVKKPKHSKNGLLRVFKLKRKYSLLH